MQLFPLRQTTAFLAAVLSFPFLTSSTLAESPDWLLKDKPDETMDFIWGTAPGVRYELWVSDDLSDWQMPLGVPAPSEGLAESFNFPATDKKFFHVIQIDEQPPEVVEQFPAVDGFAVKRFADIEVELDDYSGIDPSTIQLTVGALGTYTIASPQLSFENGVLSFDNGGDTALGAYGETIAVTLSVSDTKGNPLNHTWSFRLELEPQVAGNVFVFGSPTAQRTGQRLNGPAATLASRFYAGPVRMNTSASPWRISSIGENTVIISYSGGTPPSFTAGQLICNLAPASRGEIFYRRILSFIDNAALSQLELATEDVALSDFIQNGSASFSEDSVVLEFDSEGTLVSSAVSYRLPFDIASGFSLSNLSVNEPVSPHREVAVFRDIDLGFRWIKPKIEADIQFEWFQPTIWHAIVSGDMERDVSAQVELKAPIRREIPIPLLSSPRMPILDTVVPIGGIPVHLSIGISVETVCFYDISGISTYRFGFQDTYFVRAGARGEGAKATPVWSRHLKSKTEVPFVAEGVSLTNEVGLKSKAGIDVVIWSAVGVKAFAASSISLQTFTTSGSSFTADLSQAFTWGIETTGKALDLLGVKFEAEFPLSEPSTFRLWPPPTALVFSRSPSSGIKAPGESVTLFSELEAVGSHNLQWFHNNVPIPGQTKGTLFLGHINFGHAGNYFLRAVSGNVVVDSEVATLSVAAPTPETIDTDGDGIPDIYETNTGTWVSPTDTGTDPYKWDTDGDGFSDGVETRTFVYVSRNNTGTDPNLWDTDADGVGDKDEVDRGTNPLIGLPVSSSLQRVAAGSRHSHFIKNNGTLWAMGLNSSGQLGDGTTTNRLSPVQVASGVGSVAAGNSYSLFIKLDGSLWAMGRNSSGQLGDGTIMDRLSPIQVASGVAKVAIGHGHSLFIKTDGSLWAMGRNSSGQLGDGTITDRLSPIQVASGVTNVAAGDSYSLFIKTDDSLWAMGSNYYGQLCDGTTMDRRSPIKVANGIAEVAASFYQSFFIKTDGSLWAVGANQFGQLGDGTTINQLSPVQVAIGVAEVAAGSSHTLFIKDDGALLGMGSSSGLGDGTAQSLSPRQVASGVVQTAASHQGGFPGSSHSLYVRGDGSLWAMGANSSGQLGEGTTTRHHTPVHVASGL